ncbi:hypothetical protein BCR43DRAFT_55443 [Syncephalastrum racemosum]|uniref:Uncharacterized protein n=1 Tax=Syncephalastrum racemosum TaxID=13706 RepID=A0A1X2HWP4_SYNRA|nr:hypothetical protein BCR43DRAFT_55443 [Syncephalastrum racemosum]
MLRPAKIFTSLRQIGHYLNGRVADLVRGPPRAPPPTHALVKKSLTTHAFFQHHEAPLLSRLAERQRLLYALQQQFPIVKVFSHPTLYRPSYTLSFAKSTQMRTIVSSGASPPSVNTLGDVCSAAGGLSSPGLFNRTAAVTRLPFAARQFSTAKSPCVTLFQQQSNTAQHSNNVFSHVSSRFFSPAGNKVNSPLNNANNGSRPVTVHSSENEDDKPPRNHYSRIFQRHTKGMSDIIQEDDDKTHLHGLRHGSLVRRTAALRTSSSVCRRKPAPLRKMDYIRHDDMLNPRTQLPTARRWVSSRRLLTKADASETQDVRDNERHVVYLAIALDENALLYDAALLHNHNRNRNHTNHHDWLTPSLMGSRTVADLISTRQAQVVLFLEKLSQHGTFQVDMVGTVLRVYMDRSINDTRRWLADIGLDPYDPLFTIESTCKVPSEAEENDMDWLDGSYSCLDPDEVPVATSTSTSTSRRNTLMIEEAHEGQDTAPNRLESSNPFLGIKSFLKEIEEEYPTFV